KFVGEDGYFSMVFDFSYMNIEVKNGDEWYRGRTNWTPVDLRNAFFNAQEATAAAHGSLANVLRSEEHTSELQSRFDLVCRLLLLLPRPSSTLFPYTTLFRSKICWRRRLLLNGI